MDTFIVTYDTGMEWETVIGPFPDRDTAETFHEDHIGIVPSDGGYLHAWFINAETAKTPDEWLIQRADYYI